MKKPAWMSGQTYAGSLFFAVRGKGFSRSLVTQTVRIKALPALIRTSPRATDRARDLSKYPPTKWDHAMECALRQIDVVLPRHGLSLLHGVHRRKWSCTNYDFFIRLQRRDR